MAINTQIQSVSQYRLLVEENCSVRGFCNVMPNQDLDEYNLISGGWPYIISILIGIVLVISSLGSLRSKKWALIGIYFSNVWMFLISLYIAFMFIFGAGNLIGLLVPVVVIGWIFWERKYL